MAKQFPSMHGRDHRWWGAVDNIPPDPYLFFDGNNFTAVASDTTGGHNLSLATLSGNSWGTNAPELFGIVDDGTGVYVVELKANLFYHAFVRATVQVASAPAAGAVARIGLTGSNFQVAGDDEIEFHVSLGGTQHVANPSRIAIFNLPVDYGVAPIQAGVTLGQNSGVDTSLIHLDLYIVARAKGNTDF